MKRHRSCDIDIQMKKFLFHLGALKIFVCEILAFAHKRSGCSSIHKDDHNSSMIPVRQSKILLKNRVFYMVDSSVTNISNLEIPSTAI